jgi:hypothetical protein
MAALARTLNAAEAQRQQSALATFPQGKLLWHNALDRLIL